MNQLGKLALIAGLLLCAMATSALASQPGIACVQNQLNALGFTAGGADGNIGPKTRQAAEDYRKWMADGAGGSGWNEPALTAMNGEAWCAKVAQDHPEVAKYVTASAEPVIEYSSSNKGGLVATVTVPFQGKVTGFELHFGFKTECENDLWASIKSPNGRSMVVMDRGLHRCSGSPETFSGDNTEPGPFAGVNAKGKWQFVMKDLDANYHNGFLQRLTLKLTVNNKGTVSSETFTFPDLPKPIPSPI